MIQMIYCRHEINGSIATNSCRESSLIAAARGREGTWSRFHYDNAQCYVCVWYVKQVNSFFSEVIRSDLYLLSQGICCRCLTSHLRLRRRYVDAVKHKGDVRIVLFPINHSRFSIFGRCLFPLLLGKTGQRFGAGTNSDSGRFFTGF